MRRSSYDIIDDDSDFELVNRKRSERKKDRSPHPPRRANKDLVFCSPERPSSATHPSRKSGGRDQYEINRELLAIYEYAMYKGPLNEHGILSQIIHQWEPSTVKSLLDRIAIEVGVQPNCSCSPAAEVQLTDQVTQTETKITTQPVATTKPTATPKKGNKKRKTAGKPSTDTKTSCDMETEELPPPASSEAKPNNEKSQKVPPIVISEQKSWLESSKQIQQRQIQIKHYSTKRDGIQIQPVRKDDHHAITKLLEEGSHEFHTYKQSDEKTLRAVLRGIPQILSTDEIHQNLVDEGFDVISVARMHKKVQGTRTDLPLILVQMKKTDTNRRIFTLTKLGHILVKVEHQRAKTYISQCHRCQKFGHNQDSCHRSPRCVKCGQQHISHQCEKPRDSPATCANCGGPHPASFRGCRAAPQTRPARQTRPAQQARTTHTRPTRQPTATTGSPATRQEGRSYAQVAADSSRHSSLKDVLHRQMQSIIELLDKLL